MAALKFNHQYQPAISNTTPNDASISDTETVEPSTHPQASPSCEPRPSSDTGAASSGPSAKVRSQSPTMWSTNRIADDRRPSFTTSSTWFLNVSSNSCL